MDKENTVCFLEKKISEVEVLLRDRRFSPKFNKWRTETSRILERVFGKTSSYVKDFKSILYNTLFITTDRENEIAYEKGLNNAKEILQGIVDEIKEFGVPSNTTLVSQPPKENIFNITQNQSVNVNVESILEKHLTVKEFKELNSILKDNDKEKKEQRLSQFFEKISGSAIIEIIKSLLN